MATDRAPVVVEHEQAVEPSLLGGISQNPRDLTVGPERQRSSLSVLALLIFEAHGARREVHLSPWQREHLTLPPPRQISEPCCPLKVIGKGGTERLEVGGVKESRALSLLSARFPYCSLPKWARSRWPFPSRFRPTWHDAFRRFAMTAGAGSGQHAYPGALRTMTLRKFLARRVLTRWTASARSLTLTQGVDRPSWKTADLLRL